MILQSIIIYRRTAGFGAGPPKAHDHFDATVQIHGEHGEVKLKLGPDLCERVVSVLADEVVKAARETAQAMTAEALEVVAAPQLENNNAAQ